MKPNMHDNFKLLEKRVLDSLEKTDLERIKYHVERIKTPTITTGVGGSSVVSNYASKVLSSNLEFLFTQYVFLYFSPLNSFSTRKVISHELLMYRYSS